MTVAHAPSIDAAAALNARARRSIMRVVGHKDAATRLPDDALADFIAGLRIDADTLDGVHATLAGRPAAASSEQDAFPSYDSFDCVFTYAMED